MFRLVVLSCMVALAVAAPAPGAIVPVAHAYTSHVVAAPAVHAVHAVHHAVPAAVSHQSRVDVHSAPVVRTVAVPAVHHVAAVHAVPAVHSVAAVHAVPAVHTVHSVHPVHHHVASPVVAAYSAHPVVAHHGLVHHL